MKLKRQLAILAGVVCLTMLPLGALATEIDSDRSYFYPSEISSQADQIESTTFNLRDTNYQSVLGLKVNRIEFEQNGKVIASTEDVDSYSVLGRYIAKDIDVKDFEEENGNNKIDVVFYLYEREVARLEDVDYGVYSKKIVTYISPYTIGTNVEKLAFYVEIMNGEEDDDVEVTIESDRGDIVADFEELSSSWYDEDEYSVTCNAKLEVRDLEDLEGTLKKVVKIDGKKVEIADDGDYLRVTKESEVTSTHIPQKDEYYYKVEGLNLVNNGKYHIEVLQDGEITGKKSGIKAEMNDAYEQIIDVDIKDLLDEKGAIYTVKLYDEDDNQIHENTFLDDERGDTVKKDKITRKDLEEYDKLHGNDSDEGQDIDLDYSGYRVLDKKTAISKYKLWTIAMTSEVSADTISENVYVIDKRDGKKLENEVTVYGNKIEVQSPRSGYESGHTYSLYVDSNLKSESDAKIKQPVVMEFEIE